MVEGTEKDERRLEVQVVNALARLGDAEAREVAEALLADPDVELRARQVGVVVDLCSRHGGDAVATVRHALGDPRAEVREAALQAALDLKDEALPSTVASLLGDRADGVRGLARRFIRELRCQHRAHLEPVLAFLLDPRQELNERIGAIQALMYPHSVEFVAEMLLRALEDPEVAIRIWAGRALPFFEDREWAGREVLARLNRPIPHGVEVSLLWALARLKSRVGHDLLRAAASCYVLPAVVEPAAFGLGLLGDPDDLPLLREAWEKVKERKQTTGQGGKPLVERVR